jgi:conjugative transposon TraN protein
MKWYRITVIIFSVCASLTIAAQTNNFSKASFIESYRLEVTYNKTTNLIFPAAITSVDRGSQDILVQKATGVENILRVKADVKDFSETSLSIITADGKLYSFVVEYCQQPAYLNINVARIGASDTASIIYSAPGMNKSVLAIYADSVLSNGANMRSIHTENSKVSFGLNALYIHESILFLKFAFTNNSYIKFDIDQLHFYIRDKVKAKRTAIQEIELTPLSVIGNTTVIRGDSEDSWVVALQKFTIPDGKYLSIEIMEKNGGRNLSLKVKNRKIMKAKAI